MDEYKSQKDLYISLIPALNVKLRLLKNNDFGDITRMDIWNYLKNNKWRSSVDLTLADMVNDIIHTDNGDIYVYVKKSKGDYS